MFKILRKENVICIKLNTWYLFTELSENDDNKKQKQNSVVPQIPLLPNKLVFCKAGFILKTHLYLLV